MSNPAHWMKPCKPGTPTGRHVLLYVEEKQHKGRVVPGYRTAWCFDVKDNGWSGRYTDAWTNTDQLDGVMEQVCLKKGETTLWLLRGWTDLVLSGLTELMDRGIITWRYVSMSGRCCLVKGSWRGRTITITALPNWTGNRWDSWGDCSNDAAVARMMTALGEIHPTENPVTTKEQYHALCQLAAIVSTCNMLALKRIPPTAGAAGMLLWRSWMGPVISVEGKVKSKKVKKGNSNVTKYVAPIPSRPISAANAERHTCYALTTRQLRRGLVQGPIYVMDLRSAYLVAMTMTPLPIIFDKTLHKPKIDELCSKLQGHTGCALVRINTEDWYYPCRIGGKTTQCNGRFWTWLAGAELIHALCHHHIEECWTAYTWHAELMSDKDRLLIDTIKASCERYNMSAIACGWRSVYSALVGRFAGWQRIWKDSPAHAGFGPWAQWVQADAKTGVMVPHRSVAGKVQYLADKTDKADSVPIMFGCITSMARWILQTIVGKVDAANVYCIAADAAWLSQEGWQKVLKDISAAGLAPDNVRVKAIYDRAWMSGGNIAVTERRGVKELHMPGVSNGAAIDSNGQVTVEHTDDWDSDGTPSPSKGIRRRKHRYTVAKIIDKYSFPCQQIPMGERVSIPLLGQALLRELKGERTVEDA